jgi:hypothetical protein
VRYALYVVVVLASATLAGCAAAHGPVVDTGSKPAGVGGTISGTVTASGTAPVVGRRVTAINTESGARFEAVTATNGGYTIKVPVGKYRMEVELRANETLATQPDETEVNTSDLDPDRDFVITVKAPGSARAPRF